MGSLSGVNSNQNLLSHREKFMGVGNCAIIGPEATSAMVGL
jgi:hypothetical protein